MDQKFEVSDKTKSTLATAEQTVSSVGSAIMKRKCVSMSMSWVTSAFGKVTKATADADMMAKENSLAED